MAQLIRNILLIAFFLLGCGAPKDFHPASATKVSPPRQFTQGEALYIRYCSGCHGWEGRGDGPMAMMFEVHPPPLAGSRLDENELMSIIKVLHGDSPMILTGLGKVASIEADVSALLTHIKRLPQLDWEKIDKGRHAYESLCAFCHGVYGGGDGILASAQKRPPGNLGARSFQLGATDEQLARIVSDGQSSMPGAKAVLDEGNIEAIVSFIRVLSPGFELYERFCARCHGSDGYTPAEMADGIVGVPPLAREKLVGVIFNNDYFRNRPEAVVRSWVEFMYKADHSSMPRFNAELSGSEVREIVRYLRELDADSRG
ncbi:MAG TPA: c-type cytochrome [Verrucomicrobiae bacterium]|nr:c-type cytochrome [Verrucomicrobiae bacterium]